MAEAIVQDVPALTVTWAIWEVTITVTANPPNAAQVVVELYMVSDPAKRRRVTYGAADALTLADFLNTGDFSQVDPVTGAPQTMWRAILQKLLNDGHLTGVVADTTV